MRLGFGGFSLNTGNLRLEKDGAPAGSGRVLSQREFRLLCRLLEAAPDVVHKETLFETLWPDEPKTLPAALEARLHGLVKGLRDHLGDDAASPRYIETLKGTGYRIVADVTKEAAEPSRRQRSLWFGVALAAALGAAGLWTMGPGRTGGPTSRPGPAATPTTASRAAVRLSFLPDPPLRPGVLEVGGTHEGLSGRDHVWILLSDAYGNWYPQFPPAEIHSDGTWVAHNVSVGPGITRVTAVLADDAAEAWLHDEIARRMKSNDWAALKRLPDGVVMLAWFPR